jgi:3-deoxy-manno-octulosonate cytidylyltransferase (CMP-KDO synthetase)
MIGEYPMIVHCWQRAQEAGLARVVVACDDDAIASAITDQGGEAVLTDPDLPSGSDRIWQALTQIDPEAKHDIIVNLQGDMPTLDPRVIGSVLAPLHHAMVDIATLVAPIHTAEERHNPAVVKAALAQPESDQKDPSIRRALYFSRSLIPSGDGPHYHHIGIYAYRRAALEKFISLPPSSLEKQEKLEQLRALEAGMRLDAAIVNTVPLGVDTPAELENARRLL